MATTWNKLAKNTSDWARQFTSPPIFLLCEDGSFLLKEDSGKIILEQPGVQTWNKQSLHSSNWSLQLKN